MEPLPSAADNAYEKGDAAPLHPDDVLDSAGKAKFTKNEKRWMMYDWGNSAYSMAITSTIFPLVFKAAYESMGGTPAGGTALWGYSNSISTFLVAMLAPALGSMADVWGNKEKFFKFFALLGIVSTAALAFIPQNQWLWLLVMYVVTVVGFSGSLIFYDAFLVDVSTGDRMDIVSSYGYALGYIGSTIPFIVSIAIVFAAQMKLLPISNAMAASISFLITAVWWYAFSVPMFRHVKQRYGMPKRDNLVADSFRSLGKTFASMRQHKNLMLYIIAYFFYIDGVGTIIKMATSYGSDMGLSSTNLLLILLLTQFVAFPFAILYGKLAGKFGTKRMMLVAIALYTGVCIYAFFIKTVVDFLILAVLVGTSQGGIQALSRSYFGRMIPKEQSNEYFGFFNIFGKFAAIMGPALVGFFTQLTGKTNYGVLSIIVLFIIGGALLLAVKEPGKETPGN